MRLTDQQVIDRLADLIEKHGGSLKRAGERFGYSGAHLCRLLQGRNPVPDPLLREMGIRRVVIYEVKE